MKWYHWIAITLLILSGFIFALSPVKTLPVIIGIASMLLVSFLLFAFLPGKRG